MVLIFFIFDTCNVIIVFRAVKSVTVLQLRCVMCYFSAVLPQSVTAAILLYSVMHQFLSIKFLTCCISTDPAGCNVLTLHCCTVLRVIALCFRN